MIVLIIYAALLMIIILVLRYNQERFSSRKVAILLTTCVNPTYSRALFTQKLVINERFDMYLDRINRWQKNPLDIIVVESSNNSKLVKHDNVKYNIIDLSDYEGSSTQLEAISVLDTYKKGYFNGYDLVIKITGKYYIPEFAELIDEIPSDTGVVYQSNHHEGWQNSEIFGFKPELCEKIFRPISERGSNLMETHLHNIHQQLGVKMHRLPPVNPTHVAPRADGSVLITL